MTLLDSFNFANLFEPLPQLMGKSRDWEELQYTWTEWRRKSGRDMRDLYEQVAELTNEAAKYNSNTNKSISNFNM